MDSSSSPSAAKRLLWIVPVSLSKALYAPARIEPAKALASLGWDVTLISVGEGVTQLDNIQIRSFKKPAVYFWGVFYYHVQVLHAILRQWRAVDVVFFNQHSAIWILPLKAWRFFRGGVGPQFVMDTRDLNTLEQTVKNRLRIKFFNLIHALANRWADGQTTITARMAELVHVPEDKLWGVWPSGVVWEQFAAARSSRQWPDADAPVHLMYIGKFHWERNLLPLCAAVKQANENGRSFQLTLIGKGSEQAALEEFARECPAISIGTAVPHSDMPQLLSQAHIGITSLPPSDDVKFAASSPIKLFEYTAAGLPILSTRNPCHTDVVQDGVYAFWVQEPTVPALLAALEAIWQARSSLVGKGEQAAAAAKQWTWQESGNKINRALTYGLSKHDKQ